MSTMVAYRFSGRAATSPRSYPLGERGCRILLFVQHSVEKAPRCYVCDELSGELTDS
jgi:hypothetical protein